VRLVTRPDLDGLTCAVLLSQCEPLDSIELVQIVSTLQRNG
jgi:hypothetical protein